MSKSVVETVAKYRQMENIFAASSMLLEVRNQYADMAEGGDGGSLGFVPSDWDGPCAPSCREYNYAGKPDSFFQAVKDLMGWL